MSAKTFIHDQFLLESETARDLYEHHARPLPIIDYHCHLPANEIAEDRRWENIAQVWLYGDHYKWRAMRSNGVDEALCTGNASDWEKFEAYASCMPYLLRNPLYHWTHLELKRYFNLSDRLLGPDTARDIWEMCNARMQEPDFSARGLMRQSGVAWICTTDDPTDSLAAHNAIAADPSFDIGVYPTWRPDKAMAVEDPATFNDWTERLAAAAGTTIRDFDDFMQALEIRHAFFHACGCRLSDHGLNTAYAAAYREDEIPLLFRRLRNGESLTDAERLKFKSAMLFQFGIMDHRRDWTQQFHFGAQRNNNTRMLRQIGPDTGFDSIGDEAVAAPLARLLDRLDRDGRLTRTILYNLNPRDNALMASMIGNFQCGPTPGKIQFGSGWWFLDQKNGMEEQMESLSQLGLLRRFVGMLTDSRSFLSYTRHDYFRRILCNLLGQDAVRGLIPDDPPLLGAMVEDICYRNAARYFKIDAPHLET
jgi:glucuronate isomerase